MTAFPVSTEASLRLTLSPAETRSWLERSGCSFWKSDTCFVQNDSRLHDLQSPTRKNNSYEGENHKGAKYAKRGTKDRFSIQCMHLCSCRGLRVSLTASALCFLCVLCGFVVLFMRKVRERGFVMKTVLIDRCVPAPQTSCGILQFFGAVALSDGLTSD